MIFREIVQCSAKRVLRRPNCLQGSYLNFQTVEDGLEEPTTTEMKHLAARHCNFIVDFLENSVNQLVYAE